MRALTFVLMGLTALVALPVPANDTPTLRVAGTQFVVTDALGQTVRGADLVGAELDLGPTGTLRIVDIDQDTSARFDEVWLHRLELRQPDSMVFQPFCAPDPSGDTRVVVYPGYFDGDRRYVADPERFSMSCVSGVEAKCLRWGYLPWRKAPKTGESLEPYYNACISLARADYCGSDEPSTRNGTAIDIYDRVGVQESATSITDMAFEAGWNQHGAVCVAHTRIVDNLSLDQLLARCPRLVRAAQGKSCDERAAVNAGALLFNRSRLPTMP